MAPNRAELKDIAVALCLEGDDEYRETLLLVISIHNYHKLQIAVFTPPPPHKKGKGV